MAVLGAGIDGALKIKSLEPHAASAAAINLNLYIMKKPFTAEGFQELLSSLYQLPDTELQLAAGTLAADLRSWLEDHFILSEEQLAYLLAVDDRQIANAAAEGRHFMVNRLPITFIKEEKPAHYVRESEGKFFDLKKTSTSSYVPLTGYSQEEELVITISYI